jgi:hypothetical protein
MLAQGEPISKTVRIHLFAKICVFIQLLKIKLRVLKKSILYFSVIFLDHSFNTSLLHARLNEDFLSSVADWKCDEYIATKNMGIYNDNVKDR